MTATKDVTEEDVVRAFQMHQDATFVTFTGSNWINRVLVEQIFLHETPIRFAAFSDDHAKEIPLYHGMHVTITENRNKTLGVVNGFCGSIVSLARNMIFVLTRNEDQVIPVHPVHSEDERMYNPLRVAYSNTIAKVRGQTLNNIIIWLDSHFIPPGCAYVALS